MRVTRVIFCSGFVLNAINRAILWQIVNKRLRGREAKQRVIEAAGRASIGKLGMTPKIKENIKTAVGTHSVSCDSAGYHDLVVLGGNLLTCWLILVQH